MILGCAPFFKQIYHELTLIRNCSYFETNRILDIK